MGDGVVSVWARGEEGDSAAYRIAVEYWGALTRGFSAPEAPLSVHLCAAAADADVSTCMSAAADAHMSIHMSSTAAHADVFTHVSRCC